jgi:hypothetical protein
MEDLLNVASGDGPAHLREHGSDETETGTREELGGVEGGE